MSTSFNYYWITLRPLVVTILLGLVAVLAMVFAYTLYEPREPVADVPAEVPAGLTLEEVEAQWGEELIPSGKIYFTATNPDNGLPYTYVYDLDGDYIEQVSEYGYQTEFEYVGDNEFLVVAYDGVTESVDNPDFLQPAMINTASYTIRYLQNTSAWGESQLTLAASSSRYIAWSEKIQNINLVEGGNQLTNWRIVIPQENGKSDYIIENASNPKFVEEGAGLMYIKKDGIYYRDLSNNTEEHVGRIYGNLSYFDEFVVSNDRQWLVMTLPTAGLVSVQSLDPVTGQYDEYAMIAGEVGEYISVQIDPSNSMYAVLQQTDNKALVQVRSFLSTETVKEFQLVGESINPLVLEDWEYFNE